MTELIPQITAAIIWMVNALIAVGTIPHNSMCFVDLLFVVLGGMLFSSRSMARGGGRMYSSVKTRVRGLMKR